MKGAARLLPLLLWVCALGGCTVSTERDGDVHYVVKTPNFNWIQGKTTSLEVAQSLGPPDSIQVRGDDLWFFYRFNDKRTSRLVLNYYVNVFQRHTVHSIDSQLVVTFDADDKLLTHGISAIPSEGALLRHFD